MLLFPNIASGQPKSVSVVLGSERTPPLPPGLIFSAQGQCLGRFALCVPAQSELVLLPN